MNANNKRKYILKWNKFQQQYEKYFEKKFATALQLQLKSFIKSQDVMSIPSYPIYEVLLNLYKTCGVEWAKISSKFIKKADGQMGINERIIELMNQYFGIDLLNDAELMTRYSREIISNILMSSIEKGLSFDDIVNLLLVHPEFNKMRAMRIARTETVTAANAAAYVYANESGVELNKIWIAVKDKRTRHDHSLVDGITIDYNQPFIVGGIEMMQPGVRTQPNGLPVPAKETVNCRCTSAYIAKRDSQGKIISKR